MDKYKVVQKCEAKVQELRKLSKLGEIDEERLKGQQALAEAIQELTKLQHRTARNELEEFQNREKETQITITVQHSDTFLNSRDHLYWYKCFVRLFPRGDCAERCVERPNHLPSWRWCKTLLTRADSCLWRQDVEFIASLYNIQLRRAQVNAVEMFCRKTPFT